MYKNVMSDLEKYFYSNPKFNSRIPNYNDDSDYTTNAPSYYDDLARKNKLMKILALRIWEYEEEMIRRLEQWDKNLEDFPDDVKKLLEKWLEDGTLDHIINDTIFSWKANLTDLYELSRSVVSFGVTNEGDQSVNLQKALDWSSETGNSVYFPSDLKVNVNKSLKMDNDAQLIMYRDSLIKSNIPDGEYLDHTAVINITGDNVKLFNPLIEGDQSGVRPIDILERKNILIKDGIIKNFKRSAVYINQSENIITDGLTVYNCGGELDEFSGTLRGDGQNIIFKNCHVYNSNGKAITLVNSTNSKIFNCTVDVTIHPAGDGIYISKSDYCSVYGNTVINPSGNLLKVSRVSSYFKIYDNNFNGDNHTGAYGVMIQGGRKGSFINNTVSANNDQAVLWIEDHPDEIEGGDSFGNEIIMNRITCGNDLMFGIHERTRPHANNPGFTVYENNISDNTVMGGRYGILSRNTKRSKIKGNTIINTVTSAIILEEQSQDIVISSNIIRTLNANGITLNDVFNINVGSNSLYTNGGGIGINVINSKMNSLHNNTFNGFVGYGIHLDINSTLHTISGNTFNQLNAGIRVRTKNLIYGNNFENVSNKIMDDSGLSEVFGHDNIDNFFGRTLKIGPGGVILNRPLDNKNFRLAIDEDGNVYAIEQEG